MTIIYKHICYHHFINTNVYHYIYGIQAIIYGCHDLHITIFNVHKLHIISQYDQNAHIILVVSRTEQEQILVYSMVKQKSWCIIEY